MPNTGREVGKYLQIQLTHVGLVLSSDLLAGGTVHTGLETGWQEKATNFGDKIKGKETAGTRRQEWHNRQSWK